jgi:hypothetical protein
MVIAASTKQLPTQAYTDFYQGSFRLSMALASLFR